MVLEPKGKKYATPKIEIRVSAVLLEGEKERYFYRKVLSCIVIRTVYAIRNVVSSKIVFSQVENAFNFVRYFTVHTGVNIIVLNVFVHLSTDV